MIHTSVQTYKGVPTLLHPQNRQSVVRSTGVAHGQQTGVKLAAHDQLTGVKSMTHYQLTWQLMVN